jgi:hypothetical protein
VPEAPPVPLELPDAVDEEEEEPLEDAAPEGDPVDVEELPELLDPCLVSPIRAGRSPSNWSRSTTPLLPEMPGTVPLLLYCQKRQVVKGAGTSGQETSQSATQIWAWASRPAGLPRVPVTKLGEA